MMEHQRALVRWFVLGFEVEALNRARALTSLYPRGTALARIARLLPASRKAPVLAGALDALTRIAAAMENNRSAGNSAEFSRPRDLTRWEERNVPVPSGRAHFADAAQRQQELTALATEVVEAGRRARQLRPSGASMVSRIVSTPWPV